MTRLRTVLLDIDGTLINDSKIVTPFTRAEITRVQRDHGASIVLASARMPMSIMTVFDQLELTTPFVAYSGAYCEIDGLGAGLAAMPTAIATDYLEHTWLDPELQIGVFVDDSWFVNKIDYWTLREIRGCGVWPTESAYPSVLDAVANGSLRKIMLRGPETALDLFTDSTRPSLDRRIKVHRSSTQLELYPSGCSKSHALHAILSKIGSSFKECIAFGDGETDRDMLEAAAIGVAMSNATSSLISAADEVTLSNNEDGVGLMLRKYFPAGSHRVPIVAGN